MTLVSATIHAPHLLKSQLFFFVFGSHQQLLVLPLDLILVPLVESMLSFHLG